MANLYNKAGLVNIPIGYSDGFLYNIKPVDDTLAFRFNRDSAATRVNKEGLIEQVGYFSPELVQNGNFSELGPELVVNGDFATDSDWNLPSGSSISGGSLNIDGTQTSGININQTIASLDLTKIYKVTFTVSNYIAGNVKVKISNDAQGTDKTANGTYTEYLSGMANKTLSIRANADFIGSIDNISVKQVDPNDYWSLGTGWGFGDNKAICDGTQTGNTSIQQSNIAEIGKKYKIKFDLVVTSGFINYVNLGGWIDQTNLTTSGTYVVYTSTTTATDNLGLAGDVNFIGSITNISVTEVKGDKPRIDYTDSLTSPSFLLEPQRTNLITYSEDFSQWNTLGTITTTSNYGTSPDGTNNSTRIIFSGGSQQIRKDFTSSSGVTGSVYIKGNSGETIKFGVTGGEEVFTLNGNWQRLTTYSASSTRLTINTYGAATARDIQVWGAQTEAGSYATSYIPTAGSTVTRAEETCNGAGNVSTFNDSEGVLYAEIAYLSDTGTYRTISINDGSNDNMVAFENRPVSNQIKAFINVSGVSVMSSTQSLTNVKQFNKIAIKWKQDDFAWWVNGVQIYEDLSGSTFGSGVLNKLNFNNGDQNFPFEGNVKSVIAFKEALTDDELQQLTGPEYNSFAALAAAYNYTVI